MLEQQAKKCIELRKEYVEQIPSFVAEASFIPCWAKDFSAPPHKSATWACFGVTGISTVFIFPTACSTCTPRRLTCSYQFNRLIA
jgi:hypothetical protein